MLTRIFYQAVENTTDAVIITDKNGKIRYVNPAFLQITGYSEKEVLGKTPRVIKSGKHDARFYRRLWLTILSGKPWRATVINRKKNGDLFYTDHSITPVKNKKGKITHFIGIWKDVSHQKQLEKQKDEFIGLVSHELKTPITSLKAFIQILEEKIKSPLLPRMNSQIDKLTDLAGDLLDVTKINTGNFTLSKQIFYLNDLIKEVITEIQMTIGKNYNISFHSRPKVKVNADRFRISQVLTNLLTNAIKYSPKSKKITVVLRISDKNAVVAVQDYGIGIPKNKQKYLFHKYYRAHTVGVTNQRFTSLGLGLFISREIIIRHRGKMWFESAENKGSTFYFSLPLL